MNQRIEENLEGFLSGSLDASRLGEFQKALAGSDAETRWMVERMARQSRLIQSTLRVAEQADPGAGFYARVMDRIEAQRAVSPFWSAFLDPLFFRRLVMASATLLLLLAITLFTGVSDDIAVAGGGDDQLPQMIMVGDPEPLIVTTTVSDGTAAAAAGRDVVLGDLTTYQE